MKYKEGMLSHIFAFALVGGFCAGLGTFSVWAAVEVLDEGEMLTGLAALAFGYWLFYTLVEMTQFVRREWHLKFNEEE